MKKIPQEKLDGMIDRFYEAKRKVDASKPFEKELKKIKGEFKELTDERPVTFKHSDGYTVTITHESRDARQADAYDFDDVRLYPPTE